ncbi:MAG: ABC-type polysaccharide/polyol phosphate export permease, partial [Thermoproteota archaeon]
TLTMTTPIYVSSAQLLKSFKLNPLVLVVAQVLDNLINFLFAFLVICIPILFMSDDVNKMGLIFMPLNLLILIVGTLSASMFLSVLNVFFRDTNFVLQFAISILFFMTPIFYPLSYIPQNYRWLVSINPFYYFIEPFRNSLVDFQMEMYLISLGKAGIAVVTVSLVTYIYWRRKKNEFYYHL